MTSSAHPLRRPRSSSLLVFGLYAFSWSACSSEPPPDPDLAPSNDAADKDDANGEAKLANGNGKLNSNGGNAPANNAAGQNAKAGGNGQNNALVSAKNGNTKAGGTANANGNTAAGNAPVGNAASGNAAGGNPFANNAPAANAAAANAQAPAANQAAQAAPSANAPANLANAQTLPAANTQLTEPPLDQAPAPNAEALLANQATPVPAPAAPAPVAPPPPAPLAAAPLLKDDLTPALAKVFWVGYDYLEKEGLVRIEMVTRGSPKYHIFQERNQLNQPELVVRFFNAELRHKLRRDIDATEFRSPVAFIRLRPDLDEHTVDVVMTMRDAVQPRLYNKYGNVMLTFAVPDRYFGNNSVQSAPVAQAELLPDANIMPLVEPGSEPTEGAKLAKAFINDPGREAFVGAPPSAGQPAAVGAAPAAGLAPAAPGALPPDFAGQPGGGGQAPAAGAPPVAAPILSGGPVAGPGAPVTGPVALAPGAPAGGPVALAPGAPAPAAAAQDGALFPTGAPAAAAAAGFDADTRGQAPIEGAAPPLVAPAAAPGAGDDSNQLNDDKFDDFDDGKGDSGEAVDKFDVRAPVGEGRFTDSLVTVASFTSAGVAADDAFGTSTNAGSDPTGNTPAKGASANAQAAGGGGGDADLFGEAPGGGGNAAAAPVANAAPAANAPAANSASASGEALLGNPPGNAVQLPDAPANPAGALNLAPTNAAPAANPATAPGAAPQAAAAPAAAVPAALPAAPLAAAPLGAAALPEMPAGEPPLEGAPDLAGQESEGTTAGQSAQPGSGGGRPMKVDFRGAPLTEVIRVLSDESHVNFILPPDLGDKKIYISLNGVPFNDALKAILDANALTMVAQAPNLVRIDTIEHFATEKEAEERRRRAELKLRPTKILVHRLSYAKVDDAAKMLGEMLGGAAKEDKRISVQIDQRTNSVIVNAPPGDLATVKALLERIDLETPQVKIASRIVEVIKKFKDSFGINWGAPFNFDQGRGLGFGNLVFPNSIISKYSVDAGGNAAKAANSVFHFGSVNNSMSLDLALAMEETAQTAEVLQSGNLIVEDNHEANIVAGSSEFFRPVAQPGAVAGVGATGSLDEIKYNLSVKVTPHITADGSVQMALKIESDTAVPPTGQAAASKNNRSIDTSLLRRSGETAVIGGIYNTDRSNTHTGVPFLSSLPIIGALFRSSSTDENKRELMVLVTPTILTNSKAFAASADPSGGAPPGAVASAAPAPAAPASDDGDLSGGEVNPSADAGASDFGGGQNGGGQNGGGQNGGGEAAFDDGGGNGGNAGGNGGNGANAGGNASGNGALNAGGNGGNGGGNTGSNGAANASGNGGNFGGNGGGNGALTNAKNNAGGSGGGEASDE